MASTLAAAEQSIPPTLALKCLPAKVFWQQPLCWVLVWTRLVPLFLKAQTRALRVLVQKPVQKPAKQT